MIPVFLSIKGLYSYKETQEIDFTSLTSSGLFGIFGAVGSGKSSILEAIVFVLFNESDRLNAKFDNRYYNMLNLQSDELALDFIFLVGPENSDKYRFRFLSRRNKKDYEKVEIKEKNYYQWKCEQWEPLEHIKDASEILGMSYQNFMQTIIIPQGKFREFIDRSATERTKMLKELFRLDKFDLSLKTNFILKQNELQLENLSGMLQGIGVVSEEEIEEKEIELKEKANTLQTADLECKALKAEEGKMNLLKKLFDKIRESEEKLDILEHVKADYAEKEKKLAAYENAYTYLKEKISTLEGLQSELEVKQLYIKEIEENQKKINDDQVEVERAFLKAKDAYLNQDCIKLKCEDLEKIIEIKELQVELIKLKGQVMRSKTKSEEINAKFLELKNALSKDENLIQDLEKAIPDQTQLQEVFYWHEKLLDLEKISTTIGEDLKKHEKRLAKIVGERNALIEEFGTFDTFEDFFQEIEEGKSNIENQKNQGQMNLQNLIVQEKMVDLTLQLKKNEPCPVCGSLQHPVHAEVHSVSERLQQAKRELQQLDHDHIALNRIENTIKDLHSDYKNALAFVNEKNIEKTKSFERISVHQKSFTWHLYKDMDFQLIAQKRLEVIAKQKQLILIKELLKAKKEDIENLETSFEKAKKELIKYENDFFAKEAVLKSYLAQLKVLQYEKFEKFEIQQLQENLRKGKAQLEEINKEYEEKGEILQRMKQEGQKLLGQIVSENKNTLSLEFKKESLQKEVESLISSKGFLSIQQVREILAENLDIQKERKGLEDYNKELHSTKATLKSLYSEADGMIYEPEKHENLIKELENIEELIQKVKKEAALIQKEIQDLTIKLATKKDCERKQELLKEREQNLKELRKLFMGNGFVRYVSSVYLQELCKAANQRFFKLTNNSLSLELNKDEEFIVRDYLNNGKTRLLKTLSGGQTFQAALCLALALAENVKSLNKADKSFFFLDEGFGSLDRESLRVVFDTLKTLRKENRIVGIISHVEELQQEIDVYLKIVNDKEKGSLIQYSWK